MAYSPPRLPAPDTAIETLKKLSEMFAEVTGGTIGNLAIDEIVTLLKAASRAQKQGDDELTTLRATATDIIFGDRMAFDEKGRRVLGAWREEMKRERAEAEGVRRRQQEKEIELLARDEAVTEREQAISFVHPTLHADGTGSEGERGNLELEQLQMYESIVNDSAGQRSIFFCVVPSRSLPEDFAVLDRGRTEKERNQKDFLIEELGLIDLSSINDEQLGNAMSILLSGNQILHRTIHDSLWHALKENTVLDLSEYPSLAVSHETEKFANYLVNSDVVPFEASPLEAISLRTLTKASGPAIGAYIGFVISGTSPLLLITVPAGMVLCGAASGIAYGLDDGLRARVRSLISRARAPRRIAGKQTSRRRLVK